MKSRIAIVLMFVALLGCDRGINHQEQEKLIGTWEKKVGVNMEKWNFKDDGTYLWEFYQVLDNNEVLEGIVKGAYEMHSDPGYIKLARTYQEIDGEMKESALDWTTSVELLSYKEIDEDRISINLLMKRKQLKGKPGKLIGGYFETVWGTTIFGSDSVAIMDTRLRFAVKHSPNRFVIDTGLGEEDHEYVFLSDTLYEAKTEERRILTRVTQ